MCVILEFKRPEAYAVYFHCKYTGRLIYAEHKLSHTVARLRALELYNESLTVNIRKE